MRMENDRNKILQKLNILRTLHCIDYKKKTSFQKIKKIPLTN